MKDVRVYFVNGKCGEDDCQPCSRKLWDSEMGLWYEDITFDQFLESAARSIVEEWMTPKGHFSTPLETMPGEIAVTINGKVVGTLGAN